MDPAPKYRAEFWRSPHHAALALLTVGLGFLSAQVLPLIVGVTAYALGWIYIPDMSFFRHWVDRRFDAAKRAAEEQKVNEFIKRREALVTSLSPERRARYLRLAQVCRDIEAASSDSALASPDPSTDPRLRKLDELMWTYLRLLGIEESLEKFITTEQGEDVPTMVKQGETEVNRLNTELESLKKSGNVAALDVKQRLLSSRMERLEVLRKRQQRCEQGQSNLQLVLSEQDRLDQQIKLIRADAVASKNAETLTARIDATVEHLDQTNKWLSELDEFKDLVGDMPSTELRVGYEANATPATATAPIAPPIIQPTSRIRQRSRQQQ